MTTVAEVIDAVKHFTDDEKDQFLAELREVPFEDTWDRKIEEDAKAGRLDALWNEAKQEIAAGKTKPLDELLDDE